MNIEESKNLLGWVSLNKLYIDTHNECDYHNIHTAIETLLTAYEKEKEKNKELNKYIEDRAKIGKNIQTFINKDYVEQEYISKDKIKPIQIIDLDGKIHNVYKIEEEQNNVK